MSFELNYHKYFPEIGQEIWFFQKLPRAMDVAKDLIKIFPQRANGRIIISKILSSAKGRFNRKWLAEEGGLWMALTLYDEFLTENYSLIPLILGLAAVRCVYDLGIKEVKLKWINDIHFNGKKIGGILLEKYENWYIAGIGLNVNNSLPPSLPAITLKYLLNREINLIEVLELLIYWLKYYFGFLRVYEKKILEEQNIPNLIIKDFKNFSDTIGRCVAYSYNLDKESIIIGKVIDITEKGSILLETQDFPEKILEFSSGEILYFL